MKRALALALSLVLVLAVLPLAVSARNLTDGEKQIFIELRDPAPAGDGAFTLPEETIQEGENYLMNREEPLTQEQIDTILKYIRDAKKTVTKTGTGEVANWSQEVRNHILQDIDSAAQVLGLRARGNGAGKGASGDQHGYGSIEIYQVNADGTETVIVAEDNLVKKTGSDLQSFVICGACGLVVLCACAFVSKKVELF